MDKNESLNSPEELDKFELLLIEFISHKYTFLEVILLWVLLTVLDGLLGSFTAPLSLWVMQTIGVDPAFMCP